MRHTNAIRTTTKKRSWTGFTLYRLYSLQSTYTKWHADTHADNKHIRICITLNSCETNNIFAHLRFNFRDIMAMTKFELSKKNNNNNNGIDSSEYTTKKSLKCSLLNVLRKTHVLLKTHALFVHMMLMLNRVNVWYVGNVNKIESNKCHMR